jgi:hypothetical protein
VTASFQWISKRDAFSEQLETLNAEPARFLSDAQLIRPLEETAAAVKKDGEYSLLNAGIPVRAEDENGDPAKVEFSLEPTPKASSPSTASSTSASRTQPMKPLRSVKKASRSPRPTPTRAPHDASATRISSTATLSYTTQAPIRPCSAGRPVSE